MPRPARPPPCSRCGDPLAPFGFAWPDGRQFWTCGDCRPDAKAAFDRAKAQAGRIMA